MQVKFYHDLYVSETWMNKKRKIMKKLKENRLQPECISLLLREGSRTTWNFIPVRS